MNRLLLLLALACAASSAQADGKLSPEARHLLAGRGAVAARTAPAGVVSAYVHLAPGADASALAGLGVEVNLRCGDILTARVPVASLAAVASLPGVEYVQAATPVAPMMDVARPAARVDLVQQGAGVSVLPSGVVTRHEGIVELPLQENWSLRHLRICRRTDRTTNSREQNALIEGFVAALLDP